MEKENYDYILYLFTGMMCKEGEEKEAIEQAKEKLLKKIKENENYWSIGLTYTDYLKKILNLPKGKSYVYADICVAPPTIFHDLHNVFSDTRIILKTYHKLLADHSIEIPADLKEREEHLIKQFQIMTDTFSKEKEEVKENNKKEVDR